MLAGLFAVRTTWIGALVVVVAVFLIWFFIRAIIDFVKWFKEEIIDDFRDRRKKKDKNRKSKPRDPGAGVT